MQYKMLKLFVTFFVLFSIKGFSQNTEKSEHPLLDKYYPHKQNAEAGKTVTVDTKPAFVPTPAPLPAPKPITKTVPSLQDTTGTIKPIISNEPVATNTPIISNSPAIETKTLPSVADTTSINKPIVTNKPINAVVQTPVPLQQKVVTHPPSSSYMDTRLGSSTPAYDTWTKNNNGAGSVTTSPK